SRSPLPASRTLNRRSRNRPRRSGTSPTTSILPGPAPCGRERAGTKWSPRCSRRSTPAPPTPPTWTGWSISRCCTMRSTSPGNSPGSSRCGTTPTHVRCPAGPWIRPRCGSPRTRSRSSPRGSFLGALGSDDLWEAFGRIGIRAIHTGPVKLAGGLSGWSQTPSIDGHFDRISMAIDPLFGTEDEFRAMQEVAVRHGGTIIDDIVPGHTGRGADFLLAQMNHSDYPGIYHMVSIPEEAWHLLPEVPEGMDSVNLSPE